MKHRLYYLIFTYTSNTLDNKNTLFSDSANMLGKNKKTNVKSENNLESKVNKKSSKNKVEDKKAECKHKKTFKI